LRLCRASSFSIKNKYDSGFPHKPFISIPREQPHCSPILRLNPIALAEPSLLNPRLLAAIHPYQSLATSKGKIPRALFACSGESLLGRFYPTPFKHFLCDLPYTICSTSKCYAISITISLSVSEMRLNGRTSKVFLSGKRLGPDRLFPPLVPSYEAVG
jgi:hypothetical protein